MASPLYLLVVCCHLHTYTCNRFTFHITPYNINNKCYIVPGRFQRSITCPTFRDTGMEMTQFSRKRALPFDSRGLAIGRAIGIYSVYCYLSDRRPREKTSWIGHNNAFVISVDFQRLFKVPQIREVYPRCNTTCTVGNNRTRSSHPVPQTRLPR